LCERATRGPRARLTETRLQGHGSAGTRTRNQRLKRALIYLESIHFVD
jgi:hypothetical protein